MKSFWWLLQRALLALLVGAVPAAFTGCGDDDAPPGQAITLISMTIAPETADAEVGDDVSFAITTATVLLDPNDPESEMVLEDLSPEGLMAALEDGTIDQSEHDAIVAALGALEWSSDDTDVATVAGDDAPDPVEDADGVEVEYPSVSATASAEGPGDAKITATIPMEVADPDGFAAAQAEAEDTGEDLVETPVEVSADLTVGATLDSIEVSAGSDTIGVGGETTLTTTAIFSDGSDDEVEAVYTSESDDIATVDADGTVTGVSAGEVQITASYEGQEDTITITVDAGDISLEFADGSTTLGVGEDSQLAVMVTFADGSTDDITDDVVSWSSSDEDVATVNGNGRVTGVGAGDVTITAELADGSTVTFDFTVTAGDLEELQITPNDPQVAVDATEQLTATAVYADSTENVTGDADWSSSDTGVAMVSGSGEVTGVDVGSAEITAEFDGVSATVTVEVVAGTALVVTPANSTIAAGTEQQLTATVTLTNSYDDVTSDADWSSSNDTVASVDGDGLVKGLSEGDAEITAEFGGLTATVNVTVTEGEVAQVVITPNPVNTAQGVNVQLSAEAQYTDGTTADVTGTADWSSDNTDIGVSADGLVSADNQGTATITAEFDGVAGEAVVVVSGTTAVSLSVDPSTLTIGNQTSATVSVTATLSDGTKQNVTSAATYSTASAAIATADAGVVTGNGEGMTTITIAFDGVEVELSVTVTAAVVKFVQLSPGQVLLPIGSTQQMAVTGVLSDNTTQDLTADPNVSWTTADGAVASVSAAGLVTGVAKGQTQVTATYANGSIVEAGSAPVTVTDATVESIALTPTTATIPAGYTEQFVAVATMTDGSQIDITENAAWASADTATATVAVQNGVAVVTGVAAGTTNVTVTRAGADGPVTATASITVTTVALTSISINPVQADVPKGSTQQFQAVGVFSDGSTHNITRTATWSVVDPTQCPASCVPSAVPYVSISNDAGTEGRATAVQFTTDADFVFDANNPEVMPTIYRSTITAQRSGVSATARMGVTSNVIVDISIAAVDDAGDPVTTLPLGETVHLTATCEYEDGRVDPNCEDILSFTSSQTAVTVDSMANTATGAAPGGSEIAPVLPPSASASVTANSVVLTVLDCDFDTLTVDLGEFPAEPEPRTVLALGGTAQALAILHDNDNVCPDITLSNGVAWSSNNSASVSVSAAGMVTASSTPTPPVSSWDNIPSNGDVAGLNIVLTAVYTDSNGNQLNDTGSFTLRDACVDTLVASPFIGNRHPIPQIAVQLSQETRVIGSYSIPGLPDVDLTDATAGLQHFILDSNGDPVGSDDYTNASIAESSGVLSIGSDGLEGTFSVLVRRDANAAVLGASLPGGAVVPLCPSVASSTFDVVTVDSPVTGIVVSAPGDRTNIGLGEAPQLTAEATFADDSIAPWDVTDLASWFTSDADVLGVNGSGLLQVPGNQEEGSAVITALFNSQTGALTMNVQDSTLVDIFVRVGLGQADNCASFMGTDSLGNVDFGTITDTLPDGLVVNLRAIGEYSNGTYADITDLATFAVASGNATIDNTADTVTTGASGDVVVTATAPSAVVDVTSEGTNSLSFDIANYDVQGISITPTTDPAEIPAGASQQFQANVTWDAVGASTTIVGTCQASGSVTWGLTPAAIGTVSGGLVDIADAASPNDEGDLTATLGGITATRNILVSGSCVSSIALNQATLALLEDDATGAAVSVNVTMSNGQPLSVQGAIITYAVNAPAGALNFGPSSADAANEYSATSLADCSADIVTLLDADSVTDPWTCFDAPAGLAHRVMGLAGAGTGIQVRAFFDGTENQPVDVCPGLGTSYAASSGSNPTIASVNQTVSEVFIDCDPLSDDVYEPTGLSAAEEAQYPNFGNPSFHDFDGSAPNDDLVPGVNAYCSVYAVYSSGPYSTIANALDVTAQVSPTDFTVTGGVTTVLANETFTIDNASRQFTPLQVSASSATDQEVSVTFQGATSDPVVFGAASADEFLLEVVDSRTSPGVPVSTPQSLALFGDNGVSQQYWAAAEVDGNFYDITSIVTWASDNQTKVTVDTGLVTPVSCVSPNVATISATSGQADNSPDSILVTAECATCDFITIDVRDGGAIAGAWSDGDVAGGNETQTIGLGEQVQFGATCTLNTDDEIDVTADATWTISSNAVTNLGGGLVEGLIANQGATLTAQIDQSTTDTIPLTVSPNCVEEVRIREKLQGTTDGDIVPLDIPLEFVLEGRLSGDTAFTVEIADENGPIIAAVANETVDIDNFSNGTPEFLDDQNDPIVNCAGLDVNVELSYTATAGTVTDITVTSADSGAIPRGTTRQYEAQATFSEFAGSWDVSADANTTWYVGDSDIIQVGGGAGADEYVGGAPGEVYALPDPAGSATTVGASYGNQSDDELVQVGAGVLQGLVLQIFDSAIGNPSNTQNDCAAFFSDLVENAATGETAGYFGTTASADLAAVAALPEGGFTSRVRVLGDFSDDTVALLTSGFTFTVTDENGQSTDTTVAADGTITTGTDGEVRIQASSGAFDSNIVVLNVANSVQNGVTALNSDGDDDDETLAPGQSSQLLAAGSFSGSTWYCLTPDTTFSATSSFFSVSAAGVVSATSAGSTTVTATSGVFSDGVDVVVTPDLDISSLALSLSSPYQLSVAPGSVQIDVMATLTNNDVIDVTADPSRIYWLLDDDGLFEDPIGAVTTTDECPLGSPNDCGAPTVAPLTGLSISQSGILTVDPVNNLTPGETFTAVAIVRDAVRDSSVTDSGATQVDESAIRAVLDIVTVAAP